MAEIDEISRALGRMEAKLDDVGQAQRDHSIRDDEQHEETRKILTKLSEHVNHENELMRDRIKSIEDENEAFDREQAELRAHRKGMWKAIGAVSGTLAFIVGNVVLFLSGTYEHFFGH